MGRPDEESLIATLDTGTSSIRCMIFNSKREVLVKHQLEIGRIYPQPSWVEQDAEQIISKSVECINKAIDDVVFAGFDVKNVRGVGIANQRETTVVWDKHTGKPLYNAILWSDNRTADLAATFINGKGKGDRDCLQSLCGLPVHPYFSALKLRWLIDNVEAVRDAIERHSCLFGTVDSWVLWNLTGGIEHGIHKTDVTNASRTMLMNLKTLDWDDKLIEFFDLPRSVLPKICSSSEEYGEIKISSLAGQPVCGILGDQQAALVGHGCFKPGNAKNTYGTGCFLLANIGEEPKMSRNGLLTTVAYQLGKNAIPVYAFEGSVAMGGSLINWLQKNLGVIDHVEDMDGVWFEAKGSVMVKVCAARRAGYPEHSSADALAGGVEDSGGIYFVPAFSGLLAPYWDTEARGVICGLTEYCEKAHFARAALEAVAYQICEIIDAIKEDSGIKLTHLQVDGGMSHSTLLMQIQSNFSGIPVRTSPMPEITSLGAAVAVAHAVGLKTFLESRNEKSGDKTVDVWPKIGLKEREKSYQYWKEAVRRSMHWERDHGAKPTSSSKEEKVSHGVWYALSATGGAVTALAICGLVVLLVDKYR